MRLGNVFRVTLIYLVFGLMWILFSDALLDAMYKNDAISLSRVQTMKGIFYVAFTTLLLYILVRRYSTELNARIRKLQASEAAHTRSEDKYRTLFEASPMPVFIYNQATGHILNANAAAIQMYGYTEAELTGMPVWHIVGPDGMHELDSKLNIAPGDAMHLRGIRRHIKKNGEQLYAFTQDCPMDYDDIHARILIANDITRQIQYIEAIEAQNDKLNRISFAQSHTVRSPLASIMGLVHVLQDTPLNSDEYKQILAQLHEASARLDTVIRSISNDARPQDV